MAWTHEAHPILAAEGSSAAEVREEFLDGEPGLGDADYHGRGIVDDSLKGCRSD